MLAHIADLRPLYPMSPAPLCPLRAYVCAFMSCALFCLRPDVVD